MEVFREVKLTVDLLSLSIYINIERESDYGALQSAEALCVLRSIFNFKSKMFDLNRSI
jgi:hypothetical protein